MEDLGSLLPTTVNQNGPKISPCGVEMPQMNAALMSALESVDWFVLHCSFFVLDKLKSIPIIRIPGKCTNSFGSSQEQLHRKQREDCV